MATQYINCHRSRNRAGLFVKHENMPCLPTTPVHCTFTLKLLCTITTNEFDFLLLYCEVKGKI